MIDGDEGRQAALRRVEFRRESANPCPAADRFARLHGAEAGTLPSRTLLVLGSKPDPALPEREAYDDVGCTNGSGFSAAQHSLPVPEFTVMGTTVSGGKTLKAIAGHRTRTLFFFPRTSSQGALWERARLYFRDRRAQALYLRTRLKLLSYRYDRFIHPPYEDYQALVHESCDFDPEIAALSERKHSSCGITALLVGLASPRYQRVIISGFSFELTHAYGRNPAIDRLGTTVNRHAEIDIAVLRYLAAHHKDLYTSEPIVHERTGIPLI